MIIENIKKIKSGKKEILEFALVLSAVLIVFAVYFIFKKRPYFLQLLVISDIILSLGLFLPSLLKPLQKIWMIVGIIIGGILTYIVLITTFFVILIPISLISKLANKKFLDIKIDKKANTYWTSVKTAGIKKEEYKKQF